MRTVTATASALEEVAELLINGGVAVIPTDTVYGLAAHPDCPQAVERLYTIKGREAKKPIALLAADVEAARRFLGGELPPGAKDIASVHWPGALTLVLPVNKKGGGEVAGYEGLRVPDHDWTRRLLALCGGVLRVTSANLSGMRPATDVPAALADVGLSADMVVDDGVSPGGVASTVLKIEASGQKVLLRDGPVKIVPSA